MIDPINRREIFMNAIATGCECPIEPVTREEMLLAAHAKREASGGGSSGGGGGVTSWNDLQDKPFYTEITKEAEFTYDPDNEFNFTRSSGETVYYVHPEYFWLDASTKAKVVNDGTKSFTYDDINHYQATSADDDGWISVRSFTVSGGNPYSGFYEYTVFSVGDFEGSPVSIDFNGEEITFAKHGLYVSGELNSEMYISKIYDEYIQELDKQYLPKAYSVEDAAGETVTADEFNALLYALRSAGYLSE